MGGVCQHQNMQFQTWTRMELVYTVAANERQFDSIIRAITQTRSRPPAQSRTHECEVRILYLQQIHFRLIYLFSLHGTSVFASPLTSLSSAPIGRALSLTFRISIHHSSGWRLHSPSHSHTNPFDLFLVANSISFASPFGFSWSLLIVDSVSYSLWLPFNVWKIDGIWRKQ